MMIPSRKIIHIDMDAFFAAIEQRDNPEYRGKPVIVGNSPERRGVVATCSYEARVFGIHSGMATKTAIKRAPHAIVVKPRLDRYKEVSKEIRKIFFEYTDLVEPVSLDEAYLDLTVNKVNNSSATLIAKEIKNKIKQRTGLTGSAGVSYNKFLAKIASDYKKPDGLTVVKPEDGSRFIDNLKIRAFHGIGKATEKRMNSLGIFTGKDLKRYSLDQLVEKFSRSGEYYYNIARGIDNREVKTSIERKSVGGEHTFPVDIDDKKELLKCADMLIDYIMPRVAKLGKIGRKLTIKLRYANFELVTRSKRLSRYIKDKDDILFLIQILLEKTDFGKRKIRLFGISIGELEPEENCKEDLRLF